MTNETNEQNKDEMTMADFEKEISSSFRSMKPGDIVTGVVIGISDTEVTLDLNYYAEGIIKIDELSNDPKFSIKGDVAPGDEISAVVMREDRNGNILLSKKQADDILAWEKLRSMMDEKTVSRVKVQSSTNSGVIAYIAGIRAFIPASKLAAEYVENPEAYVGRNMDVVVIDVDEDTSKVVLSAKDVIKEKEAEERNLRASMLKIGTVMEGSVERIEQYGAFVGIGNGLSGLVHVSEISEKRIRHPGDVLKVGQKVMVKLIDHKNGKLSLSIKAVDEKDVTDDGQDDTPAASYTFGDAEPVTMASLFANIKLKK